MSTNPTPTPTHTLGPWQTSNSPTRPFHVYAPHGQSRRSSICVVTHYEDDPEGFEAEANAHLIAAAPELLAVLREIQGDYVREFAGVEDALIDRMRAAIAAAKGESS